MNKSAKTALSKLYNDFILRFGSLEIILHDQGREFENELFHNLSKSSEYLDCVPPHITQCPVV